MTHHSNQVLDTPSTTEEIEMEHEYDYIGNHYDPEQNLSASNIDFTLCPAYAGHNDGIVLNQCPAYEITSSHDEYISSPTLESDYLELT